ncbi:MAG: T9SS type A sorting domain-containing protein [Cyclobacteriaceae bacterium]|nr:T9SS type A sorting domain-containing protein [Cyclobacteriaceae bacterium]
MRHLLVRNISNLLKVKFWWLTFSLLLIGTLGLSQAPTVDTPTVTAVGTTTATLGGNITGTLTHRGTRWHTASPVGTNNQLEEASTTAGAFTQPRTGLPAATKIFFVAYGRNAAPEATTPETTFFTEPIQLAGGQFTASATSATVITLTFPSADSWKGTGATAGYVIFRKSGSAPSLGALADGAAPMADGVGDKITTITGGALTTFNDNTGLSAATDYYYTIIPFVWDGAAAATYNYNTTTPQTANDFTFAAKPGSHATGSLTATAVSSSQINLAFNSVTTSAIANATGYIVLIKSSAIVVGDLATLADGAAPNSFGLFEAIINSTATNSYNDITGLSANTTYHYAIIPYNRGSSDETYNYLKTAGFPTGSATTLATATFTPINGGTAPVIAGTILSAGTNLQVLTGFSVVSNGTQIIDDIGFNYSGLSGQFTNEYLYRSTTAGTIGTQLLSDNTPDGNFNMASVLAANKTINSTPVYYYLVVDVANSVTSSTASVTTNPTQANINMASGTVDAFSINRSFTFSTSQLSDIILTGGTTVSINYRSFVSNSINDDQSNSVSLADYKIRDGGAANDPDNKGMSVTSIEIQITNSDNLRRVALFDDVANTEIPGTEQGLVGTGTVNIIFTPTTPISIVDNGSFDINVRATFKGLVTDKQAIRISIVSATANNTTLSGFSSVGSWASTQTASNTNVVAVTATKLIFVTNPPATPINTNFSLTVNAVDSNPYNNIDLDYTGQIGLTKSPASGTLSVGGAESLTPSLVSGQYAWTQLKISAAGTYTLDASDDLYADAIGDASGSVTISSSASTVTQPAALNLCFGGLSQTLGNIVITETDPSGFSSGGSFALTLPSGFIFDQSVTTAPTVGGGSDISAPTVLSYPSANTVQFSYTISGSSNTNSITITGLKITHPHPGGDAPGTNSGSITRSGGTASVAGVVPGTALASVNATLGSPAPIGFGFSVQKLNSGDVDVNPNETRFSQNSNAVRLVGAPAAVGGVTHEFIGAGVTFISGEYRFNPQSLSPGTYPIVFKYRDGVGQKCEFQASKTFEIYTTNITNLNAQYCNNDPQTSPMNVNSYIATFYSGGGYSNWTLQKFIYWDTPNSVQKDILSPANNIFDPKLSTYQSIYSSTGTTYGVIGIWIGFIISGDYDAPPTTVCNTICIPFGGCFPVCVVDDPPPTTQTRTIWQLIPVRPGPSVSFSIPKTTFCSDEASVTLTGTPANSNTTSEDFFSISSDNGSISSSSAPVVWSFTPGNVSGLPKTLDITYTYRDPSTGCSGTSAAKTITVNTRPTTVPAGSISKVPAASPPSTTIELCQGAQVGSFNGATVAGTTYTWYADPALTIVKGTLNSFSPPIDNTIASTTNFYVTRTIAGCESDKSPTVPTPARELTVIVHPTPGKPVPDFNIEYCVNETIVANDFKILSGSNIKWYQSGIQLLDNVSSPTLTQITSTPAGPGKLGVVNSASNVYDFQVTQTANNCEGTLFPTNITVKIKPLPKLDINLKGGFDPSKICTTGGNITFIGTDQGNTTQNGIWSTVGNSFTAGALSPNSTAGTVDLTPVNENPDNYTLKYEYTNPDGCTNNTTLPLSILPKINTSIVPLDSCAGLFVRLNNQSTLVKGGLSTSTTTIAQTSWNFSDGSGLAFGSGAVPFPTANDGRTKGTYFSPEHKFKITGSVNLQYTMRTSDGCSYLGSKQLTIAPKPEMDFSWRNVCRDGTSTTQFLATEANSLAISNYSWSFADNNTLSIAAAQNNKVNPIVNYSSDGTDFATLIATTTSQCKDTVSKPIYIVPKFTPITNNNSYTQDFNSSKDSWLVGGTNPSWEWGTFEKKGTENTPTHSKGWETNLNSTINKGYNNANEQSWVLSRCFNFTSALKPVIGLDIFSDTPFGVNGAAIQYNYNGNIEDDASWVTLGEVNKGIKWYDITGISNSPGNQPPGNPAGNDLGWTGNQASPTDGKYKEWQRAYYRLDELLQLTPAQKSNVVFRIAFAAGNSRSDGFAFDDFFIGERSRIVLLENFTNSSSNVSANNTAYSALGNSAEIVKVQYHTPFPGDDAINKLNAPMHNARTAFYGITKSPIMRLDGIEGNLNTIGKIYDDRVLTPSSLEITVTPTKVGGVVEIVTAIKNKSSQPVALAGAHIFTTIVEKSITTPPLLLGNSGSTEFKFVAKQMLPTPTGLAIPANLAVGDTYTAPKVIWQINNGDAIVVAVQSIEGDKKGVYQASVFLNPPQPDLVTGIEQIAEFIQLYPNPAHDSFVIELPTKTDNPLSVHMIDQVGRVVHETSMEVGEQTKTINTQDLAGGIYIVQIGAGNSGVVRKKMMIVHKN